MEKYQTNSGKILWGEKHKVPALQIPLSSTVCFSAANRLTVQNLTVELFQNLSAEIDRVKKENDNMQIQLRPVFLIQICSRSLAARALH